MPVINKKLWAYFAPDGYLQVRSLGTKKEARLFICSGEYIGGKHVTYHDYENNGYTLHQVLVNIQIIK